MFRCATAAVLAVLASVPLVAGADKAEKPKKPIGAWTHALGDITVTLKFDDDKLHVELTKWDGVAVNFDAAYAVNADGLAFGILTAVEKKGTDDGPEKGDLFSFQYKIDKDVLSINELSANKGISEEARQLLSGQFTAKKAK